MTRTAPFLLILLIAGCAPATPVTVDLFNKEFPWKKHDRPILFVRGEEKDPHKLRIWGFLKPEFERMEYRLVDYTYPLKPGPLGEQIGLECLTVHIAMSEEEREVPLDTDPNQGVYGGGGEGTDRRYEYLETIKKNKTKIIRVSPVTLKIVYWPSGRTAYAVHHEFPGAIRDFNFPRVAQDLLSPLAFWLKP